MSEVLPIVAFMAIVVGLAAGILFVFDRVTLKPEVPPEERVILVKKRTRTWQRRWGIFYLSCAVVALIVNALSFAHESLRRRIGWSVAAALFVIRFLLSSNQKDPDDANPGNED